MVIDEDQGHSGAIGERQGFERLVSEVGMGRAGIVLSLEAARPGAEQHPMAPAFGDLRGHRYVDFG